MPLPRDLTKFKT